MTVLGNHTIAETRDLMRTVEFRIERAADLVNRLPFSTDNVKLVKEWNEFVEVRWKNAHDQALNRILVLKFDNPLASESVIPAEGEFKLVMKARNQQGEGIVVPGDLSDLIHRLEVGSGQSLDEDNHPLPTGFDPDLAAFQAVDAKIKAGEKAAEDAKKAAGNAAKSNVGLIIGLSALGIVGVVVATKIYL